MILVAKMESILGVVPTTLVIYYCVAGPSGRDLRARNTPSKEPFGGQIVLTVLIMITSKLSYPHRYSSHLV